VTRPSWRRAWRGGAAVAALVAGAAALGGLGRRRLYRVEVAGSSMHPALQPGDWLLLRRGAPAAGPGAGDGAFGLVVAARDRSGRLLLKRIVGLPGESLRVGAAVQVNGRELIERYASGEAPAASYRGVSRLGEDELFLLGDRRDASTDSRELGPLPLAAVEGVVLARYWPPRRIGLLRRPTRRWAAKPAAEDSDAPDG
jgi:signal peptidase I